MATPLRALVALLTTLAGCRDAPPPAPPPPSPPAAEAPASAAPAPEPPDPVDRLRQEQAGLPIPSGEYVWGVSIPVGCTPGDAGDGWIGFDCRPTVGELERYYRFRFPMSRVTTQGTGVVVRPGADQGYARIQSVRRGGNRSRLVIFRDHHRGDDEGAERIRALLGRLRPAGDGADVGRSRR